MKTPDLWNRFIAKTFNEHEMDFSYSDFEKAVNERIEFAQRWMSVEEELPIKDGKYLIKSDYDGIVVRVYNDYHKCWDDEDGDDNYSELIGGKVTHWRPIEFK